MICQRIQQSKGDMDRIGSRHGFPRLVNPLPINARSRECGFASGHALASIRGSLKQMQQSIILLFRLSLVSGELLTS
jgi:hypothetical protein